MKIKVSFAWYDAWIGFYWDRKQKALYVCPVPMIAIKIWWPWKLPLPAYLAPGPDQDWRHRHGTSEPGWIEHDHWGGTHPHRHDEHGFQVLDAPREQHRGGYSGSSNAASVAPPKRSPSATMGSRGGKRRAGS